MEWPAFLNEDRSVTIIIVFAFMTGLIAPGKRVKDLEAENADLRRVIMEALLTLRDQSAPVPTVLQTAPPPPQPPPSPPATSTDGRDHDPATP